MPPDETKVRITPRGLDAELPLAVIERVADRFKLLGDPTRLRLINAMHVHGELSVGELVARVGASYGAVSKQLSMLRAQGVVSRRRDGSRIYYAISDPSLDELCSTVCESLQRDWAGWGAALESEVRTRSVRK